MSKADPRVTNIRALAILLVVFGHSIIIFDPEWGLYAPQHPSDALMMVKHCINVIQMPLFFALSGYCYMLSPWWEKRSLGDFVGNKARRLLIPFVAIGFPWMVPIRLVSRYAPWEGCSPLDVVTRFFCGYDLGHLWYLGTLFLMFVLVGCVTAIGRLLSPDRPAHWPARCLALLPTLILSLNKDALPEAPFVRYCAEYLLWFCMGTCVHDACAHMGKRPKGPFALLGLVGLALTLVVVLCPPEDQAMAKSLRYMAATLLILACFVLMPRRTNALIQGCARDSFGIYLFHSPLIYPVFCYLGWLWPLPMVAVTFLACGGASVLLTRLLRRFKVGRCLIGEASQGRNAPPVSGGNGQRRRGHQ